jgi:Raf kinase inhibitor-like YbhB/YbcL family protein
MRGKNSAAWTLAAAAAAFLPGALCAAEPFTLTSTAFKDGDTVPAKYAGAYPGRSCGGQNVSPELRWSNAPAQTKSFAMIMSDPEGGRGLGSVHWVAYGIPASKTSFAEGEASTPPKDHVGGKNNLGIGYYFGPCGPPTDAPHHYIFTLIATDLAPDALPAGLTRDELLQQLRGHALAPASIVGKYARPE